MGKYIDIISRDTWGHRYGLGWGLRTLPAEHAILHHSVTAATGVNASLQEEYNAIRLLDQIGYDRFKYADTGWRRPAGAGISYTWAVPKSGRVYEGHDVRRSSSHTAGYNLSGVGIVLVGNYENDEVTDEQIDAVARLLLEAVELGFLRQPKIDFNHKEVYATLCPGTKALEAKDKINERVIEIQNELENESRAGRIRKIIADSRLGGRDRWETARLTATAEFPAHGRGLLIAADGSPDERYATARAGEGVLYLPVRGGNDAAPGHVLAAIRGFKPNWVRFVGGPSVVTDAAAEAVLDAAGLI